MRALLSALAACAATVALAFLAATAYHGTPPSGPDFTGFAAATFVGGGALAALGYAPALRWWWRRSAGGALPSRARSAAVAATVLNAPAYALLAVLARDRGLFAEGEAALLALAVAVLGLCFGWTYRAAGRPGAR